MTPCLSAPAVARNRGPILEVLARVLPPSGDVLEIASGTGEHAVHFAEALAGLAFHPSDPDPRHRASIAAWRGATSLPNVAAPLALDVSLPAWEFDPRVPRDLAAVLCINMVHISPWEATQGLLRGAAALLREGGLLYLYGPYLRDDVATAPSNLAFDAWLRERDARFGLRHLRDVAAEASRAGLALTEVVPMPANNLSVSFLRGPHAHAAVDRG
jgi:hypothetical protein